MLCASVNAQQSRLPPCPIDRNVRWHNCFGTAVMPNVAKYVGEFSDNNFNGQGTLTYPDGRKYVGEFISGNRSGQGTYTFPDGKKYVGESRDGRFHGQGTQIWPDGSKYVGEFRNGNKSGQGTYTWPSGANYVGEFRDNQHNGQGTFTWPDGKKHVGQFRDDKFNGQGIQYAANGSILLMGIWADDKFIRQTNVNPTTPPALPAQKAIFGTAFRISNGRFVTNHHVIKECSNMKVGGRSAGAVVAHDTINDLALINVPNDSGDIVRIRTTRAQLNEAVTAAGFPLEGVFSGIAITNGTISRLSGLNGDTGQLQISAPVQPGNSGGPLLDSAGNAIGVVSSKLNAVKVAASTGDIPQNVNFAISGNVLRAFLDAKGVDYKEAGNERELTGVQIAARASAFTLLVECQ